MKFVKGKWYKNLGSTNSIAKLHEIRNKNEFWMYECLYGGKKYHNENNLTYFYINTYTCECSIDEIRHLLPKDHKFEQEFNYYFY